MTSSTLTTDDQVIWTVYRNDDGLDLYFEFFSASIFSNDLLCARMKTIAIVTFFEYGL